MNRREIAAKTILTKTGISGFDYCVNPYVGCEHGCAYCYAGFMKRFTGHGEPWGQFVDIKVNAPEVLRRQVKKKRGGRLLVGTVTDPYQPAEREYQVTRRCLEVLGDGTLDVTLLTRSPLCLRDVDIITRIEGMEVGVTVTTDRDEMRRLFEPFAPPIESRIEALRTLHGERVRTYAFVGPMLPLDPLRLIEALSGAVDEVLVDRLNYSNKVKALYRKADLTRFLDDAYFVDTACALREGFRKEGVPVSVLFGLEEGREDQTL